MLPKWRRDNPRIARLPAESCQALVHVLAQRFEQYRCTGDPEVLKRPRLSFHFNRIQILGIDPQDPAHMVRVYLHLPKFGVIRCSSEY